ncbi:hypothetical protein SO802_006789 [Lithocarpus litseifolius]|uniref:Uncharacterized protein n=1 Tax=Lithocarpus litseifolius TaxID=425828 RepID=A0AAW2DMQ1_9ROSI
MADDAAMEVSVPERTTIPSGDNLVWVDVPPLLESACKGNRDNNHKREVGEMEDAMKSLENKNLGFEKKNGHHYYTGWDEINEVGANRLDYELLKDLAQSGFQNLKVIDKDRIEFCGKSNGIEVE